MDFAKAKGWRTGENPARWRGHLQNILPKPQKLTRGHLPVMDYHDVPAFFGRLRSTGAMAARALEFLILTAARSGETPGAQWPEIDMSTEKWIVPPDRMKGRIEHRVPLCANALDILTPLREVRLAGLAWL